MAVYHILSESESFSRTQGGASAQWIAGVVRAAGLEDETIVVCPAAGDASDETREESWGFPYVWVAPEMGKISLLPRPLQASHSLASSRTVLCSPAEGFPVGRLLPQDAIYVHNRPEMALAMVWAQQGRLHKVPVVLAINDSQLAEAPRPMVRHVARPHGARGFSIRVPVSPRLSKSTGCTCGRPSCRLAQTNLSFTLPLSNRRFPMRPSKVVYVGPINQQAGRAIFCWMRCGCCLRRGQGRGTLRNRASGAGVEPELKPQPFGE